MASPLPVRRSSWIDAELPPPNIVAVNPDNGHAHYTYQPESWVRLGRVKAVRYLAAIRRAYTIALQADPAYAGAFTHNPLHPKYEARSPRSEPYTLDELAGYVDLHLSNESKPEQLAGTPGRNCATFDAVRKWGYRVVGGTTAQIRTPLKSGLNDHGNGRQTAKRSVPRRNAR